MRLAELGLPLEDSRLADPVPAAGLSRRHAALLLGQDRYNLLLGEPALPQGQPPLG